MPSRQRPLSSGDAYAAAFALLVCQRRPLVIFAPSVRHALPDEATDEYDNEQANAGITQDQRM